MSTRLKRIEGQSKGIRKVLEDGRDCVDVSDQLSSVKAAVNDLSGRMLETFTLYGLHHPGEFTSPEEAEEVFETLLSTPRAISEESWARTALETHFPRNTAASPGSSNRCSSAPALKSGIPDTTRTEDMPGSSTSSANGSRGRLRLTPVNRSNSRRQPESCSFTWNTLFSHGFRQRCYVRSQTTQGQPKPDGGTMVRSAMIGGEGTTQGGPEADYR